MKIVISETVSHTGLVYMCLHTDAEQSMFYNLRFKHIYPVAGALLYYVNIGPVVSVAVDSWIADNFSLLTRSSEKKKKKLLYLINQLDSPQEQYRRRNAEGN